MSISLRPALVLLLLLAGSPFSRAAEPAATDTAASSAAWLKSSGLTSAQLLSGAKTGLGLMIDLASAEAAKPGTVQVATPPSMTKLESMAQRLNQTGALDSFKASLNSAATSVVPQTTSTMKNSIGGLTLEDAMTLTSGAPDSATRLLRKATESALRLKVMPLVAQAIAANGTATKAKELASQAGPMAAMLGVPNSGDLENYLYAQVLDATFGYVAKAEASVRANPALLKNATAAKVFGSAKK